MTTTKVVREKLADLTRHVSVRNGVYTARKGFFYTNGYDNYKFTEAVRKRLPEAAIIESGEKWVPFKGGHTVAQGSHWWVKFTMPGSGVVNV